MRSMKRLFESNKSKLSSSKEEKQKAKIETKLQSAKESPFLTCLLSLDNYKANTQFKSKPGLVLKDMIPPLTLTNPQLIAVEIHSVEELATRLRLLWQTIKQDVVSLEESKAFSKDDVSQKDDVEIVGQAWSGYRELDKKSLYEELSRLSYDDRLEIIDILTALQKQPSYISKRAWFNWGQLGQELKAVVRFKKLKERKRGKIGTGVLTASKEEIKQVELPKKTVFTFLEDYQSALRACDQRSGWVKLNSAQSSKESKTALSSESSASLMATTEETKTSHTSEQKETADVKKSSSNSMALSKEVKTITSSVQKFDTKESSLTPSAETTKQVLRDNLRRWLGFDTFPLPKVMCRLSAIRDFCQLANRISEYSAHLWHETELAKQVLREFKGKELKDTALVHAVTGLAAAQDEFLTHHLLEMLIDRMKKSTLLEPVILQGLSRVLEATPAELVQLSDLKKILEILVKRCKGIGSDLPESEVKVLLQGVGAVLCSMAQVSKQLEVNRIQSLEKTTTPSATTALNKTFLQRASNWISAKVDKAKEKIDGPKDPLGLPTIAYEDYDPLCSQLNEVIIQGVKNRFQIKNVYKADSKMGSEAGVNSGRDKNPELYFLVAVIQQALMRIPHRNKPRSTEIIQKASLFFELLDNAKDALTNLSISSLIAAGRNLVELVDPLAEKVTEFLSDDVSKKPQIWFEQYLVLKTLIQRGSWAMLESHLIDSAFHTSEIRKGQGLPYFELDFYLVQGLLQAFDNQIRHHSDEGEREGLVLFLRLMLNDVLWKWPKESEFQKLLSELKQRCEKDYPDVSKTSTLSQHLSSRSHKEQQLQSEKILQSARRQCQEESLEFQWHEYCLEEVREALSKDNWRRDMRRYVPALVKLGLDASDESAQLLAPIYADFVIDQNEMSSSVLLILGDAGTGKSLFIRREHILNCERYFGRQLESTEKSFQHMPNSIYLYLNQSPVKNPIENYLRQRGFSESHIRELVRSKEAFTIYLDGYDEWSSEGSLPWVMGPQALGPWVSSGNKKVVVTCRSQYLQGQSSYLDKFSSATANYGSMANRLRSLVITRLDDGGVEQLTQNYVEDEKERNLTRNQEWTQKYYLEKFIQSGITELVKTPIILLMALEVLPQLSKMREADDMEFTISKMDIYEAFIKRYMQQQKNKLLDKVEQLSGITEAAERYAVALALQFFAQDKAAVTYRPRSKFSFAIHKEEWLDRFFSEHNADHLLARIIPLHVAQQRDAQEGTLVTQYSFIHKSILDYFVAKGLYQTLKELVASLEEKPPVPPDISDIEEFSTLLPYVLSSETEVLGGKKSKESKESKEVRSAIPSAAVDKDRFLKMATTWEAAQKYSQKKRLWLSKQKKARENSSWNRRSINSERMTMEFLNTIVEAEERQWKKEQQTSSLSNPRDLFIKHLFQVIRASREYPELSQASANAITFLNVVMHVSFSMMDLKGIRVPGADLSYSIFDSTNLQDADLSNVNLQGSWLQQADLSRAILSNVQFGEWPYLEIGEPVRSCMYSPDGRWLAVGTSNKINLYKADTRKYEKSFDIPTGLNSNLTFDSKGELLAAGSGEGTFYIWQLNSGSSFSIKDPSGYACRSLALDPKGEYLAMILGSSLALWNIHKRCWEAPLEGPSHGLGSVIFDPKGVYLVSASSERSYLKLWEFPSRRLVDQITDDGLSLAFGANGKYLASARLTGIGLWNVEHGRLQLNRSIGNYIGFVNIAFDPKGKYLAHRNIDRSGSGTVRLWEIAGEKCQVLEGHSQEVMSVTFDAKGECLASGSLDGTVRIWSVGNRYSASTDKYDCGLMCLDEKGEYMATAGKTVCIWELATGLIKQTLKIDNLKCMAFTESGKYLVVGSSDFVRKKLLLRRWEVANGNLISEINNHNWTISDYFLDYQYYLDSNGEYLAAMDNLDHKLQIWKVANGALVGTVTLENTECDSYVVFDKKGEYIASINDNTVFIWKVANWHLEYTIKEYVPNVEGGVVNVTFDSNGKYLASSGTLGKIMLREISKGGILRTYSHDFDVASLVFDPKGEYLISGSYTNSIRLWKVDNAECLLDIHMTKRVGELAWAGNFIAMRENYVLDSGWQIFQILKDHQDKFKLVLRSGYQAALNVFQTCLEGAKGLDDSNASLLMQRGAKGLSLESKAEVTSTSLKSAPLPTLTEQLAALGNLPALADVVQQSAPPLTLAEQLRAAGVGLPAFVGSSPTSVQSSGVSVPSTMPSQPSPKEQKRQTEISTSSDKKATSISSPSKASEKISEISASSKLFSVAPAKKPGAQSTGKALSSPPAKKSAPVDAVKQSPTAPSKKPPTTSLDKPLTTPPAKASVTLSTEKSLPTTSTKKAEPKVETPKPGKFSASQFGAFGSDLKKQTGGPQEQSVNVSGAGSGVENAPAKKT